MGDVKKITIQYTDGREKVINRGVCFSVHENDDHFFVSCDGVAGSEQDEIAVLAIVSRIAKEIGITEELFNRAEKV